MNKDISMDEMEKIVEVLRDSFGIHIIRLKNKIAVSSSHSASDILYDKNLMSMDWSYKSLGGSVASVLDWLSRGIVLYKWKVSLDDASTYPDHPVYTCQEDFVDRYVEIPSFRNLSELRMKLELKGIS